MTLDLRCVKDGETVPQGDNPSTSKYWTLSLGNEDKVVPSD